MADFKIGIISDAFGLDVRAGIRKAAELGADGVQVWAVDGEMDPAAMSGSARRDFLSFCNDLGIEIAALCGDLGGHGFQRRDENVGKLPKSKAIVDLATDLHVPVVTTHIGLVPSDRESETYAIMVEACSEIGLYAEARSVSFAIETGPERAETLRRFLLDVNTPGMAVNYDPANMVMVQGSSPASDVIELADHIVHTHAKDGKRYAACDPEVVYESFAVGGIEGLNYGEFFEEVPLGAGSVDWNEYLGALRQIGYEGFLTIEREVGSTPEKDISMAVKFLRELA